MDEPNLHRIVTKNLFLLFFFFLKISFQWTQPNQGRDEQNRQKNNIIFQNKGNISCAYFHLILFEFLRVVQMKEISFFRYRNAFERKFSPKNQSTISTRTTFLTANKKSRENFLNLWLLGCAVVVAVLKISLGRKWSRRCPEGGAENIISVNYDETNSGAEGATASRRKVSDKWGPHELWRKL